jgi:CDP-6-deoxy-D-xylo-4-hexulose-3-dehydrase
VIEQQSVPARRIDYAGSVHDEREIEAVVEVLRGGPQALRIGRSVREFERGIAELFGKQRGIMCNSGSSALYLAVELLDLEPGDEVITPALTFSTDVAPLVRAGLVPVFVDVEPDTYNVDVAAIEPMIGPRTKAILVPNLIGNVPDWDRIRAIADAHGLRVIEDSCDALGSTLRGTPTGTRSDISVTSFALSHIITAAGTGGMVCVDDPELADRCLLLRRWGRRSEVQIYGSTKGVDRRFFSSIDGDLEYDNLFIFDELGWNFEPSELSAAFGLVQLEKLPANLAARKRNFTRLCEHFGSRPEVFALPRTTADADTAWHMFPVLIRPESGVERGKFQAHMESHGVDTRMVWTGNARRQPAFRSIACREPEAGLPNTDRVMEQGLILPSNHSLTDEDVDYIWATAEAYLP